MIEFKIGALATFINALNFYSGRKSSIQKLCVVWPIIIIIIIIITICYVSNTK